METDKKCKGRPNKFTEIGLRGRKTGVAASQEVSKDLNGFDNLNSFFASVINSEAEGLNNNNDTEHASISSMSLVNSSQGSQDFPPPVRVFPPNKSPLFSTNNEDSQQNMATFSHNENSQKTSLFSNLLPSISTNNEGIQKTTSLLQRTPFRSNKMTLPLLSNNPPSISLIPTNNEGIHKKTSLTVDSQPNKLPYISLTSIDNEDSQPNKLRHSSHITDSEDYVSNLNDLYDELEQADFELNGGPSKKIPGEDIITLDDREVTLSNDDHESSPLKPAQGADVVSALIRDDEYKEDSAGSEIIRDDPNVPIISELSKPSRYKRKKERVKLVATVDDDLYMTFETITIPSKDGENSGNSTKQDNEGNKKSGGVKKTSKPRNPQRFKSNSVRGINNARKSNKNGKEPIHVESDNEIDEQSSDDDTKKNKNISRKRNRTTDSDSDKDRDDIDHSSQRSKNRTIRSFLSGVSRNEVIENEEGGLRRSKRQRVKPLEFWRNERLVYRPHKTEVVRIPNEDADTEPKKRKRNESKNNTKRSTLRNKEESDDTITNNKAKYEGEVNVWGTNDKISTQLVYESNMIKPSPIENNEYKHAKTFGEGDFFTSGFIAIPKGCEKPIKNSNASALLTIPQAKKAGLKDDIRIPETKLKLITLFQENDNYINLTDIPAFYFSRYNRALDFMGKLLPHILTQITVNSIIIVRLAEPFQLPNTNMLPMEFTVTKLNGEDVFEDDNINKDDEKVSEKMIQGNNNKILRWLKEQNYEIDRESEMNEESKEDNYEITEIYYEESNRESENNEDKNEYKVDKFIEEIEVRKNKESEKCNDIRENMIELERLAEERLIQSRSCGNNGDSREININELNFEQIRAARKKLIAELFSKHLAANHRSRFS
ncbi:7555_t:CDS:10 [Diversispora eburnea]|uniref:7555_t:CDS:1 n=1 Tax=Diversispora eburnea TaxID=1213867 RepID=A0A9N8V9X5_9GLOM|nr:7555_t:CDS:10 [Diversispora eburnea]